MEQSTKLFIVLGFMFIVYTTLNGHLEKYLRVVFGKCSSGSGSNSTANTVGQIASAFDTATTLGLF